MSLQRVAWLVTTLALLGGAAILLAAGYQGYAGVSLAVALAAAVNLR